MIFLICPEIQVLHPIGQKTQPHPPQNPARFCASHRSDGAFVLRRCPCRRAKEKGKLSSALTGIFAKGKNHATLCVCKLMWRLSNSKSAGGHFWHRRECQGRNEDGAGAEHLAPGHADF